MSNTQQVEKRTASQRIDDLETGLMSLYQTADNMARDLMTVKEAVKLLGNKLDSVVKATSRGEPLNDEVIARIMVENNVEELKEKVQKLVNDHILVSAEEVTENSFVVGRELDTAGQVQNPRMQFVVSALEEKVKSKFPGSKVGQVLNLQEGKWSFEVQEIYSIQTPSAPQEQVASQAETTVIETTETATEETTAVEVSSESTDQATLDTSAQ